MDIILGARHGFLKARLVFTAIALISTNYYYDSGCRQRMHRYEGVS